MLCHQVDCGDPARPRSSSDRPRGAEESSHVAEEGRKNRKILQNHQKSLLVIILRLVRAPALGVPLNTETHSGTLKTTAQSTDLAEYVRKTLLESQIDSLGVEKGQIKISPQKVEFSLKS